MSPGRAAERLLAQRLEEAEATIAALLSGQVDAVVDANTKTPIMLAIAQTALRESEDRYRRILETTEEGIWLTDGTGSTTFVNRSMAAMLGCPDGECIGKTHNDFLDADGRLRFAQYLAGPESEVVDLMFTSLDGQHTWTQVRTVPDPARDGTPNGMMTMVTDVSPRREAALALRQERDRAQQYLDTADVVLLALDLEGRITLINRYACRLLGRRAESLIGQRWVELCTPERLHEELNRRLVDILGGGETVSQNAILTAAGEERLIEWRNTLQRDDNGAVSGSFSSGTDITDQARAIEALSAAEERMRFTLRSTNIGIWDLNYTSGVLRWSEILEAQYGYAPGTFPETFEAFSNSLHPEDRVATLAVIAETTSTGGEFAVRHRIVRPDGTVRFISGAGRVIVDEAGRPLRAVGISQDVTEREELERQYQHSQKMEAIGQLAGGIAHDFNNILSVILGCGEMLFADLDELEPARGDVSEIVRAARRAADLTRQLLMFSRKQVIAPRVLDLADVTREMSGMLRRVVGEDVALHFVHESVPGCVRADLSSVEQVILNLVVNARDAMPTGGEITVTTGHTRIDGSVTAPSTIRGLPYGSYMVLSVRDTGVGMDEATQRRVFEPFFTTKPVGKGTGLGLSTVFGIVHQNLGGVSVMSAPGKGAMFTVYLPEVNASPEAPSAPRSVVNARGKETILLVEDEDQVRAVAKTILERGGYRVIEMRSPADALMHCQHGETRFDLLLTDVVMPLMSGPELARRIVAIRPHVKVLCMSGYTDDSIVRHGVLEGETAFLHKPFTPDTLRRKVREVLDAVAG
jgi:two-component system cell cycle sensor histidine kinase/response regulator CckA